MKHRAINGPANVKLSHMLPTTDHVLNKHPYCPALQTKLAALLKKHHPNQKVEYLLAVRALALGSHKNLH